MIHTLLQTETQDLTRINQVIDDFITRRTDEAASMSPYYHDLWVQVGTLLSSGGKRLRPRMCMLSYSAFGGQDSASILPAAAALELLHLSMLVHDDIIDRDYIRYGIDNIAGSYDKQLYSELVPDVSERKHYAHSAAMLGGDLLLSEAYTLVAESNIPAESIIAVQKLMRQAIFEVVGGELLDTESAFRGIGGIPSEQVSLYKTASYTFTLPMLAGAHLAGLPEHLIQYVSDFGKNLGIAYQIRDDIIGVFGDELASGKSTIGDIREGKRTFMIEKFYELADDMQKEQFNRYFGEHSIGEREAEIVRRAIRASGAYDQALAEIDIYETKARAALAELPIEEACVDELEQLIVIATKRTA